MLDQIVTASVIPVERPRRPELWGYAWYLHSEKKWSLHIRRGPKPDWTNPDPHYFRVPPEDEPDPAVALRALVSDMLEALMWCGGSADFSPPNGKARGGWENTVIPLMDRARAALAQEPAR